jgi:hypothetical protein
MSALRTKGATKVRSKKGPQARQRRARQEDRFAHLNPKLAELARKQWPEKGRAERIARAKQAWKEAMEIASTFKKLDHYTLRWIAEDPDLEYM